MFCRETETNYYSKLFNLEVYLRLIVRWELKGNFGVEWKSALPNKLYEDILEKKAIEKKIGYVDYQTHALLSYCSISELRDLILGPLWEKCFSSHWGSRDIVSSDFKKIIAVRNKLAHFRNVTEKDIKSLDLFFYFLEEWSENYGKLSRFSKKATLSSVIELKKTPEPLVVFLANLVEIVDNPDCHAVSDVSIKGHHIEINFYVEDFSFLTESVINILNCGDKFITLIQLETSGKIIHLYIPLSITSKYLQKLLTLLNQLVYKLDDEKSSEQVENEYNKYISEAFILSDITIPFQFKS